MILIGSGNTRSKHAVNASHKRNHKSGSKWGQMLKNLSSIGSTCTFRSALDADVVGGAFCPNQVNYMFELHWLLHPGPFYAHTAVRETLTAVYLFSGDLCTRNSYSYNLSSHAVCIHMWHTEW